MLSRDVLACCLHALGGDPFPPIETQVLDIQKRWRAFDPYSPRDWERVTGYRFGRASPTVLDLWILSAPDDKFCSMDEMVARIAERVKGFTGTNDRASLLLLTRSLSTVIDADSLENLALAIRGSRRVRASALKLGVLRPIRVKALRRLSSDSIESVVDEAFESLWDQPIKQDSHTLESGDPKGCFFWRLWKRCSRISQSNQLSV